MGDNMKKAKLIAITIIIILITTYSFSKILNYYQDKKHNQKIITNINTTVDTENDNNLKIDFNKLQEINNDTIAWLILNNTNINYPVVQSSNNSYYLKHSFDKSENNAGWIFMDYRNNPNFENHNTIIYGHNQKDKTMFGSLKNVLNKSWYQSKDNEYIKIITKNKETTWQIFSIYTIKTTNDYLKINFSNNKEYQSFIATITNRSIYNFNIDTSRARQILTLSTCYGSSKRLVVHAVLISQKDVENT